MIPRSFVAALAALLCVWTQASAETYKLQPGDRISLAVVGMDELDHVAVIDADGVIRLPFIGPLAVGNKDIDEVTTSVAALLAENAGIRPESVHIAVAEYRPVYVIGAARGGGMLPFRPGLTVIQAAAQASATPGDSDLRLIELMEAGRTGSAVLASAERLAVAMLNRARLVAERDGGPLDPPEPPADLPEGRWQEMIARAEAMLRERRATFAAQLTQFDALEQVFDDRIRALDEERALQEEGIEALDSEYTQIQRLLTSGLATQERVNAVRTRLLDAQLSRLRVLSERTTARSEVTMVAENRRQTIQQRELELADELERLESRIAELDLALEQARRDLRVARTEAGAAGAGNSNLIEAEFRVHRTRAEGHGLAVSSVEPGDLLQPGDVLEIRQ